MTDQEYLMDIARQVAAELAERPGMLESEQVVYEALEEAFRIGSENATDVGWGGTYEP